MTASSPDVRVEHPVLVAQHATRAADVQLRVADAITKFAGSMSFVYLHVAAFAVWMVIFERSPWPTLTLVVSLEAIFLSTFVMIGQNRAAAFQQAKANHDFNEQEAELKINTALTREIRGRVHPEVPAGRRGCHLSWFAVSGPSIPDRADRSRPCST